MLPNPFVPAKKEKIYLRAAIVGTSGSGKTYTAMSIGSQLAALRGGKMAFIDTEGRSARKYADKFTFDVLDLSKNFSPQEYINAINAAVVHGYAVIVVDSFTHAWNGAGGVLDIVDKAGAKMGGNKFAGWATGRPAQNSLAEAILNAPIDIIGTMRSKTEWMIQPDPRTGKDKPVKVGLAPVQSDDFEYEFDVVMFMDMQHNINVTKTRCSELDGIENTNDLPFMSGTLYNWLTDGNTPAPVAVVTPKTAAECLLDPTCQREFASMLTELNITDSKPYLAALGNLTRYSEFAGTLDELKKRIKDIHENLNTPTPSPEDDAEPDPVVQQASAQIPEGQAAKSLGNGGSRRIPTPADTPFTSDSTAEQIAAELKNATPLAGDGGKSSTSSTPTSAAGRGAAEYYGTAEDERRAAVTNDEMDALFDRVSAD